MSKPVTIESFTKDVIDAKTLSLVQFKTEWSGACQIIAPVYEELARLYEGSAKFFITDVDSEQALEKKYGIQELPTILFFKSGAIVDHSIGLTPRSVLISKIEKALATA